MKTLHMICDRIEDELDQIGRKPELTQSDVDNIYKMVDIVKDITTIEAMKKNDNHEWSKAREDNYSRSVHKSDFYNRHGREDVIENLETLMHNARTPEEREAYRKSIEQLSL